MINRILLALLIQCFVLVSANQAQELAKAEESVLDVQNSEDLDAQIIEEFLLKPRNPFLSLLPEEKVIVKKPEIKKEPEKPAAEDPNKIPDSVIQASEKMQLNGLVWGTDHPQAIISDQLVSEGEMFGAAQVLKITQKGVQIKYEGYSIFLKNKIE